MGCTFDFLEKVFFLKHPSGYILFYLDCCLGFLRLLESYFRRECDPNADHFISLVRMQTKSAIAFLYGSTIVVCNFWPSATEIEQTADQTSISEFEPIHTWNLTRPGIWILKTKSKVPINFNLFHTASFVPQCLPTVSTSKKTGHSQSIIVSTDNIFREQSKVWLPSYWRAASSFVNSFSNACSFSWSRRI